MVSISNYFFYFFIIYIFFYSLPSFPFRLFKPFSEPRSGRTATIEAFKVAEKRLKKFDAKLIEVERGRKSAEVVVDNAKRQAET